MCFDVARSEITKFASNICYEVGLYKYKINHILFY
jgi:hypothetical protein